MVDLPEAGAPAMAMISRSPSGISRTSVSTWSMKAVALSNSCGMEGW